MLFSFQLKLQDFAKKLDGRIKDIISTKKDIILKDVVSTMSPEVQGLRVLVVKAHAELNVGTWR